MDEREVRDALRRLNEAKVNPAAIQRGIDMVVKMTERNDHTGALLWFVHAFAPGDKRLTAAVQGLQAIDNLFGYLPPGMDQLRDAVWNVAAGKAKSKMDPADYERVKHVLHLKV